MDAYRSSLRIRWMGLVVVVCACLVPVLTTHGQQAQFGIDDPNGGANGRSMLGDQLGSANFSVGAPVSVSPTSGRAGFSGSHAPLAGVTSPPGVTFQTARANFKTTQIVPAALPAYGDLSLPLSLGLGLGEEAYGPAGGMTIDQAMDFLVKQNLDLIAMKYEIPMSRADVLTASLRANPVFYADYQLVPYGHFSFLRPGGPNQADVNLNIPLDLSRKRKYRTISAERALKVTEFQFQDAVRLQIDNLYTVYVDVVAARLTLQFSRVSLRGLEKIVADNEALLKQGEVAEYIVDTFRSQRDQGKIQVRESIEGLIKSQQALAVMLNVPVDSAIRTGEVHDDFRNVVEIPEPTDSLVQRAFKARPDLSAMKSGVSRAASDIDLAKRNAYPDVYVLYQPYTYVDNKYLGVNPSYSYAVGVTANVPLFNRNQGNIIRANHNLSQTKVQLQSIERRVTQDVLDAVREFDLSRTAVIDTENEIIPTARRVRDAAENRFKRGEIAVTEFVSAQRDFNDVVRAYRDALIRHRRAMLDLNTAVGERLF